MYLMAEEKDNKYSYEALYEYLCHGAYPAAVDKKYKHGLRKRSKFFLCKEGQLFYTGGKSGANNLGLVIQQDKEKRRAVFMIRLTWVGTKLTRLLGRTNLYNDVSRYVSWNLAV